jgi:hypothetical protein
VSAPRSPAGRRSGTDDPGLIATLCDHAQGNLRALMIMADDLLAAAAQREASQIEKALFFGTIAAVATSQSKAGGGWRPLRQ